MTRLAARRWPGNPQVAADAEAVRHRESHCRGRPLRVGTQGRGHERRSAGTRRHRGLGHVPALSGVCSARPSARCWAAGAGAGRAPSPPTTRTRRRSGSRRAAKRWRSARAAGAVQDLFLSTPDPPYLDKTSATTVHAALGLAGGAGRTTSPAPPRSAVGSLLQALALAGSGGTGRRTHDAGGRLGPPHRAGRLGRGA